MATVRPVSAHCSAGDRLRGAHCSAGDPPRGTARRLVIGGATLATALALPAVGTAAAAAAPTPPAGTTSHGKPVDLDVLFVGAHPDDEAFTLSTFGQWNEYAHVKTGVITITRGEGGGNAVGPEEGPALGLIREAEERRAVGRAGIRDVFNLDKVDFYYTVSSPLTEQIWGHDSTLAKVVRVIRETRPEVVTTMDPAPAPGNHGNHQFAARMAIEAYYAAADPNAFPEQISREHLKPFRAARLFQGRAALADPKPLFGEKCTRAFTATNPAANVYGVWSGRRSERFDETWAQVAREAQREYKSQGWAGFADVNPDEMGCNYFTQIDSRVPFPAGTGAGVAGRSTAMLDGALIQGAGGLPLGTEFYLGTSALRVVPGQSVRVTAHVRAPHSAALPATRIALRVPAGWTAHGSGSVGTVAAGQQASATFTVTSPAGAATGTRVRVAGLLTSSAGTGYTDRQVELTPPVRVTQQPLPQVAQFDAWAQSVGVTQLTGSVQPVLTLPSGGSRTVTVTATNVSASPRSGIITMQLPAGFGVDRATRRFAGLAPHASTKLAFRVTNTDASLPTSNEGGVNGDYGYRLVTRTGASVSTTTPALELVPVTTIPHAAAAPTVDGTAAPGEYAGPEIDLSRLWEGDECTSAADCSAVGHATWYGNALYLHVQVTDDVLGTKLDATDCKRHWRTDSVEIALDPRGRSENTSTTFKAGILPVTNDPAHGDGPCFERDADNRQGPGPQTAPGMRVASKVSSPYTGYTIETKIPMKDLPGAVDPKHLGLNIFVYDSDAQDKTGQTRIGWSTWGGVQGDPYRWGLATLPGYTPPAGTPTMPPAPVIPRTALQSVDSPQSILQAVRDNVPLAGGREAPAGDTAWATGATAAGTTVTVTLRATGPGIAHVHLYGDGTGVLGARTVTVPGAGSVRIRVPVTGTAGVPAVALVGFVARAGGTLASAAALP